MRDLTKGSIIRLMLLFSLPILLGSLFQQAYNLVDIIIVGKKLGELSLSAVGSTTAVVSLMFNIINGLCTGFAIPVAKHYGANDMNKVRRLQRLSHSLSPLLSVSFILSENVRF